MLFSTQTTTILGVFFSTLSLTNARPTETRPAETQPQSHFKQIGQMSQTLSRRATAAQYETYAIAGINQMQTWYNAATGLWDNAWWNSANVLTMLADFQEKFPTQATPTTNVVFPSTYANAPKTFAGYINDYYDDELWWVLAWIKVYDVTNDVKYINLAAQIFEDPKAAWGTSTCGGLWWDKEHTQVGAVENELYLTAAAKLANRLPSANGGGYYWNEAIKAYTWFVNSGLINSQNLINNGLTLSTCKNDGNVVFSYNQGILLSGLVEMTWSSGDAKYNNLANTIALAAISALTDSAGVMHDACEKTGCDGDEEQFKGVFGRNIQFMVNRANILDTATRATFVNFLKVNADAIWADDQVSNQLGLVWSGPFGTATIQTQSSALDAIVGAAAVA